MTQASEPAAAAPAVTPGYAEAAWAAVAATGLPVSPALRAAHATWLGQAEALGLSAAAAAALVRARQADDAALYPHLAEAFLVLGDAIRLASTIVADKADPAQALAHAIQLRTALAGLLVALAEIGPRAGIEDVGITAAEAAAQWHEALAAEGAEFAELRTLGRDPDALLAALRD